MRCLSILILILSLGCAASRYPGASGTYPPSGVPAADLPVKMSSIVTCAAPDFRAKAVMPDNSIQELKLSSFKGKYVVLFFYPMDFTFVCPTEIIAFDKRLDDFRKYNCEIIGISTDSEYTHLAWKSVSVEEGGIGPIRYPIVADITKNIARTYGVLHEDSVALRGLFLIDPEGKIRHAVINDLPLGRSVSETMRTLRALQVIDQYGVVCPANWQPGEKTIKPEATGGGT